MQDLRQHLKRYAHEISPNLSPGQILTPQQKWPFQLAQRLYLSFDGRLLPCPKTEAVTKPMSLTDRFLFLYKPGVGGAIRVIKPSQPQIRQSHSHIPELLLPAQTHHCLQTIHFLFTSSTSSHMNKTITSSAQ